ncbi:MAG: Uncharacterized protein CEO21_5 [Microgenomates group bacterium Gr01-1014_80]|nr:MAG: Uncharacterized protein CEO21_5 [Microgenomates group bacterium Gr01-1014_80]
MKIPLALSFLLIFVSAAVVTVLPKALDLGEKSLISSQIKIPENNSQVLSVQKYVYPPVGNGAPAPYFSARSVLVKDLATDSVLYQKESTTALPIASTTKIMTALVSSEYFKPNSILTVGDSAFTSGSKIGLTAGEKINFRSLLYGMLLNSGNDAAFAIAENYPEGVVGFVNAMNKKAADLNLSSTHFDNPAGFDSPDHYSSATNLASITEEALKNSELSRIFATKETQVLSIDKKEAHKLVNLNKLLSSLPGVLGVKTGYTDAAKENLVGLVDRENHRILTVVLGSDDRFGETQALVEWTYGNYTWPQ